MTKSIVMLVEVCANSLQSALNAQDAGADRIELCSELGVGGVTPSQGMIRLVKERLSIPVHVLIRPRSGHFTYSQTEIEVMLADIAFCKELGVEGIVSGALKADRSIDTDLTMRLVDGVQPMHFTFHRAFDWVKEPFRSLQELESIGACTVLTSGGHTTAFLGLEDIIKWQKSTSLTIMAGGGVKLENAMAFKQAGLKAVHLSGTSFENTVSLEDQISMNSKNHLREDRVAITNPEVIRKLVQVIK